jgi:hypothetical protein
LSFLGFRCYIRERKEDKMSVTSIGPASDPFSPVADVSRDDAPEPAREVEATESTPLPEGLGTQIDTSA